MGMAEPAVGLLHLSVFDELPDAGGTDDLPVQHDRRDDIAAEAMILTVLLQALSRTQALIAKAKVVAHHDPADVQLPDQGFDEHDPVHLHHAAVKVEEHHVVDAELTADDVLPPDGAVDQRNAFSKYQGVRMDVKAQDGRDCPDLRRALLGAVEKGGMANVDAVKKTKGNCSLYLCHCLNLEKAFYR